MASRGRSAPRAGDKPDMRKVPDFTEQDIKELKEAFDVFDKKGNGIIDVNDLLDFMESLRINTKFPTTFTLVDRLNEIQQKSGGINFKDFVEGLQHYLGNTQDEQGIDRLFSLLDLEQSGSLTRERIRDLAQEVGENLTEEELTELIEQYFGCPTGKVDSDAFYDMVVKNVH